MLKHIFKVVALAAVFLSSAIAKEKPNFVIVLADDVSWSSFGCTNSGLFTHTPHIDKLAKQSVRFTNFSGSVAQCSPLRHELYTSLLPPTSGVYSNGTKPKAEFKNVANYLKALNYNVGITGKTHFKRVSDFQKVAGFTSNGNDAAPKWEMNGIKKFIESSQSAKKPFCMVIAPVNAHHPWTVGDSSKFPLEKMIVPPHMVDTPLTREALAKHAAEVEDLDKQVGATVKLLDEMKLADNTVLIVLSEQGTALPNGKWSIYDYGTKALCLVRWPNRFKAASVTNAVAMYCDVVPTLVDLAGGKPLATDGKSLVSVLEGKTSKHRQHAYLVHQYGGYTQRAIRNDKFKLIWTPKQKSDYYLDVMMDAKSGKFFAKSWREWLAKAKTDATAQAKVNGVLKHPEFELYMHTKDPWELDNLASKPEYQATLKEMQSQLKAEMKRLGDTFSTVDPKAAKRKKKKKNQGKPADAPNKKNEDKEADEPNKKKLENKKKREEKKKQRAAEKTE